MRKILLCLFLSFSVYGLSAQACFSPGDDGILDHTTDYICHEYVRAALINGWVDMDTGVPHPGETIKNASDKAIKISDDFIKVGSQAYAKAASVNGGQDHSFLVLNGGWYTTTLGDFAATPGFGAKTYKHSHVAYSTNECSYDMYGVTKDFSISGSSTVQEGQTVTFTLNYANTDGLDSQISNVIWVVNTNYLEILSFNNTSVTVRGKCNSGVSGSYPAYVHAKLETSAMNSGDHRPVIRTTTYVQCVNTVDCGGTLNGGPLYTVNFVDDNTNYVVDMNQGSYNWTKTSGNASWYTSNNNNKLHFNIPFGSATFTATRTGCNLTFTFYAGFMPPEQVGSDGDRLTLSPELTGTMNYKIIDLATGKEVRNGCTHNGEQTTLMKGLPPGNYVLNLGGKKKKISVKD